eukprot:CAMPEP_0194694892 /NCGR_PEP_ID=MMETSP0295-20121207/21576_1 /TAXON_ID=39354 /ORGANISM="Heterosigma akashiwo, Strain CCMP2393" /LENGTH=147 /DNA_ID=CAMNT_0039586409 /DNA_START=62 /DNA_END=503 /DNA_ORIENTATION=-
MGSGLSTKSDTSGKNLVVEEDPNKIFHDIIKGDGKAVTEYIQAGNDIHFIDKLTGNSLLHWAAWKGQRNIADYLLEQGADKGMTGYNSYTPLHLAAENGHLNVVKMMVEKYQADVDCQNDLGAPRCSDVDRATRDGFTAYLEACVYG